MDSLTDILFEATGTRCDCGEAFLKLNAMLTCHKCGQYRIIAYKNEANLPEPAKRFLIDKP